MSNTHEHSVLFLDTNIPLHYRPMKEIDWCALAESGRVTLVFCMQVIHELDEKKLHPRLGSRARSRIKEIDAAESAGVPIRPNVMVAIYNRELKSSDFLNSLSPDSNDDRIVRLVQLYQREHRSETVAIVTEDFGMRLRARAGGVTALSMNDADRLSDPTDELTRKLRTTQADLQALRHQLPDLKLIATPPQKEPDASQHFEVSLPSQCQSMSPEAFVEEKRAECEPQGVEVTREQFGAMLAPAADQARYRREVAAYLEECRQYVECWNLRASIEARMVHFKLWLLNDGSTPADDIDVTVVLPERFDFVLADVDGAWDQLSAQKPPVAPQAPRPTGFAVFNRIEIETSLASRTNLPDVPANLWAPSVVVEKSSEEWNIAIHMRTLKHSCHHALGEFKAVFAAHDAIEPFEAPYRITVGNHPKGFEGKLVFRVRVGP